MEVVNKPPDSKFLGLFAAGFSLHTSAGSRGVRGQGILDPYKQSSADFVPRQRLCRSLDFAAYKRESMRKHRQRVKQSPHLQELYKQRQRLYARRAAAKAKGVQPPALEDKMHCKTLR